MHFHTVLLLISVGALIGCGEDGINSPEDVSGWIHISPEPEHIEAPWVLTGPSEFSHEGIGEERVTSLEHGEYELSWGVVSGWTSPDTANGILNQADSLVFKGVYLPGEFISLTSGVFEMGAGSDELGAEMDEFPLHDVTISSDFCIQSSEVSNQHFLHMAKWAVDSGFATVTSASIRDAINGSSVELLHMNDLGEIGFDETVGFYWLDLGNNRFHPDNPIKVVTWYGAAAYCDWLNLMSGLPLSYDHTTWNLQSEDIHTTIGFRLPTEAEWEYACRSGTQSAFATGSMTSTGCNIDPVLVEIGWYCGNSDAWTYPIRQLISNAWGLFDMHGNVWEWCADWYSPDYYENSPGENPMGPTSGTQRVARGGSFNSGVQGCRSASRSSTDPSNVNSSIGFRPVRSVLD